VDGNPEPAKPVEPQDDLQEYEKRLLDLKHESIRELDKWLITLSGGALGVSFAFIKDLITPEKMTRIDLLFWSWMCWGLSIMSVLGAFFCSYRAMEKAGRQCRAGTIHKERPGGRWDKATVTLNPLAGGFFLGGVLLISVFARTNLDKIATKGDTNARPKANTTTTTTTTETRTTTSAP
jgi:hypothetical protein